MFTTNSLFLGAKNQNNYILKSLIISTTLLLYLFIFGQSAYGKEDGSEWTSYYSNESFVISTTENSCTNPSKGIDKEYLFLKITNTSDASVKLTYKIEKWYDGICSNCDDSAENAPYTIELKKGESISGSCENYRDRKLAIFSKMNGNINARSLTSFKIIPLEINDTNIK